MPEKAKEKKDVQNLTEESSAENCESEKQGNWSEDQREKSYYYDDAYGYEIYNPDQDDDEDE